MNNALNIGLNEGFLEETHDQERLRAREAKLVRMIESLVALSGSTEWSYLKDELFDGASANIEAKIRLEAKKPEISVSELYRLQGEQKWAKRYADPASLVDTFRSELANIRKQLNPSGPTEL